MNSFMKLRSIANIFYFFAFILSTIALFCVDEKLITILGVDFYYNKINGVFLFLANFILYLFNLNSKNSVRAVQKLFYPLSILILILINLILVVDNFFAVFLLLFLIFFINYFLNNSKDSLTKDCTTLFVSFLFISYGLLRYFIINDIPATLSNISQYQYKVDILSTNFALFGFLLLVSKLFNFLPFNIKAKNSYILNFSIISYLIIGCNLLIKTFTIFNYNFYNMQNIIAFYLIINILYFVFLQFRAKGINEFLRLTLSANIVVGIFGLFLFTKSALISFIYYSIALILSYSAAFLVSNVIEQKMHTDNFSELKKISHNDKLIKFFIFVVFLNLAKVPPCVAFCASIYSYFNIFLIEFSDIIMLFIPYILFGCSFLLSLNCFGVLGKILIEPDIVLKSFRLSPRQIFALFIVCFAILITGIAAQYITGQFVDVIDVGNI